MLKINYISKLYNAVFVENHDHKLWELVYCTRGKGTTVIDGEPFEFNAGQMLIIPPGFKHGDTSSTAFDNIHLTVTELGLSATNPLKICDNHSQDIMNILNLIHIAYHTRGKNYVNLINSLYDVLFNYIIEYSDSHGEYNYVQILENEIISNISNSDFDLFSFIRTLPYNAEYLRRQFIQKIGLSPTRYLTNKRMNYARALLEIRHMSLLSIKEIAGLCGYSNQLYFSRLFKQYYKVSPDNYIIPQTTSK